MEVAKTLASSVGFLVGGGGGGGKKKLIHSLDIESLKWPKCVETL